MVGWVLGAAINLVGSVAINLGTNVMKLGHNKRAMLDMPEEAKPAVTKFREWQIGTGIFILGNIANFVSFGFAAQSLLSALGSIQFVSNVFFASFVLKEKVSWAVILATACIIGGCLLLVLFGNHESKDYTVDDLLDLYRKPAYIVYLVMTFVFVFGSYIMYLHGKSVATKKGRENSAWVKTLPVTYSIFSALLGTQSVLFSKSLSVLLRSTFSGDNQLGNWYTYVTLLCFLFTAAFWVTRLNKGLRLFPAMIIVPLMQIAWALFSIISGMLYFEEYKTFSTLGAIMFVIGVLIVFVGVILLTKAGADKLREEQEEDAKEEAEAAAAAEVQMATNPTFEEGGPQPPPGGDHPQPPQPPQQPPHTSLLLNKTLRPEDDPDIPHKGKINMDTLRFTSLAASTAANIKAINKYKVNKLNSTLVTTKEKEPESQMSTLREGGGGSLESTMASTRRGWRPSVEDEEEEEGGETTTANSTMMGTFKKNVKMIHKRLKSDFNADPNDLKQMFGMGKGNLPALSLFAMPAVDLTSSGRLRKKNNASGNESIMSALPQSRFFGRSSHDIEAARHLEAIAEQPSGALSGAVVNAALLREASAPRTAPLAPGPPMAPPTDGRQPPPNSSAEQHAAAQQAAGSGPVAAAHKVVRLKVEQSRVGFAESDEDDDAATDAAAAAVAAAPRQQQQLPPALVPAGSPAAMQFQLPPQQPFVAGMAPSARPNTPPQQHLGGHTSSSPAIHSERASPHGLPAGPPLSKEASGQLTPAGSVVVNEGANLSQLQAAIKAAAARHSFHTPTGSVFGIPLTATPPPRSPRFSDEALLQAGVAQSSDTPLDQGMSPPMPGVSPRLSRPGTISPSPSPARPAPTVLPGIAAAAAAAAMAGYGGPAGYSGLGAAPLAAPRMPSPYLVSPSASATNLGAMVAAAAAAPQPTDPYGYPSRDSSPVRGAGLRAGSRTPPRYYANLLAQAPPAPQYQLPTAWAAPGQPAVQMLQVPVQQVPLQGMAGLPGTSFDSGYAMQGMPTGYGLQGAGYPAGYPGRPASAGLERGWSPDARALVGLSAGRPASPAPPSGGLSVSRAWSNNPASRFAGSAQQQQQPGQGAAGLRGSQFSDVPGQHPWNQGR